MEMDLEIYRSTESICRRNLDLDLGSDAYKNLVSMVKIRRVSRCLAIITTITHAVLTLAGQGKKKEEEGPSNATSIIIIMRVWILQGDTGIARSSSCYSEHLLMENEHEHSDDFYLTRTELQLR